MGKISTMLALDGEAQFRRQLNLINQNLKTLDKELQATSSQFAVGSGKMKQQADIAANYGKQLEFLRAKEDMLSKAVSGADRQLDENRKKLSQSQNTYAQVKNSVQTVNNAIQTAKQVYGENSAEVRNLQARLKELEKEEKQAAKAVADNEKSVDRVAKAYHKYKQDLADTVNSINKVEAAQRKQGQTADEVGNKTAASGKKIETSLGPAKKAVEGIGKAFENVGKAGIKTFEASVKAVTAELSAGVKGLEAYTGAVVSAGAAVVSFASSQGMSFEASMSKVLAYSGAAAEEMVKLTEAAKTTGATTSKTATEAADALGYLALNGYTTQEMLTSLRPVVKASEAGQMDLAMAANLTAATLKSYGKDVSETEELLNIMTATQNNSATSLQDLFMAYSESAGTFRTLNVDMKESATILGILADQNVKGSEAGAALNSILINLAGANKRAKTAMTDLGVSAWNEDGSFKGLTETIRELGNALSGATQEQEMLIESAIGGKTRFQELKKLISGVNDLDEYNKIYNPVSTALEDRVLYTTAETMMDNLRGKITLLTSALSGLGTSIYETFSEEGADGVEKLTHWVNILDEGIKKGTTASVVDSIRAVGARMSAELTAIMQKTGKELPSKLKIFNTSVTEGMKLLLQAVDEGKEEILPELIQGATDLMLELVQYLPDFTEDIASGAETLFTGILDGMQKTADKLVDSGALDSIVDTVCDFFENNGEELFEAGISIISKIGEGVVNNIDNISETATTILTKLGTYISENLPELLETGKEIITSLAGKLMEEETLNSLVDSAVEIVTTLATFVADNLGPLLDGMDNMVDKICERIGSEENLAKIKESGSKLLKALWKEITYFSPLNTERYAEQMLEYDKYVYEHGYTDTPPDPSRYAAWGIDVPDASATVSYGNRPQPSIRERNIAEGSGINVNVTGNTINGYNDIYKMAEDMASAIKQAQSGGGRGK